MVTGCNKGLGLGILERLAHNKPAYKFIMAVRSMGRGGSALEELKKSIPDIADRTRIYEIDISRSESIDTFIKWLQDSELKVDCLVNNAAIAIQTTKVEDKIVRETFQTNFYGTVELTEKMLPMLSENAKIVNITSDLAMFGTLHDPELQKRMEDPALTKEGLFQIAKEYHEMVKTKKPGLTEHPFPTSMFPVYCFSKLLISVYTRLLAKDSQVKNKGIQVYSCAPGQVKTNIGGPAAELSVQQGVICPSNVIMMPWKVSESTQGKFFSSSEVTQL